MEKPLFLLVVLLALAARQTGATLDLSQWKPVCQADRSVHLPNNTAFTNFIASVSVKNNTGCNVTFTDLNTKDADIPKECLPNPNSSVILKIQHKEGVADYTGGKDYRGLTISCKLDGQGQLQLVTAAVTIGTTPETIPMEFQNIDLKLEIVTGDPKTGNKAPSVSLGQDNVYLQVKHAVSANDHFVLAPMSCSGTDPSNPGSTYTFFSASENKCRYDSEIMDPFNVTAPTATPGAGVDISSAKFYPFKFTTGPSVTLTCDILVCPSTTTAQGNSHCAKVTDQLSKCQAQSPFSQPTSTTQATPSAIPSTNSPGPPPPAPTQKVGRRRRAAGDQKTHTRVLEVTYSVLDPDPVLQGPAAGGAGAAISVPLLAAVASLWIL